MRLIFPDFVLAEKENTRQKIVSIVDLNECTFESLHNSGNVTAINFGWITGLLEEELCTTLECLDNTAIYRGMPYAPIKVPYVSKKLNLFCQNMV